MACQGRIIFELTRQNVKETKKFIDLENEKPLMLSPKSD